VEDRKRHASYIREKLHGAKDALEDDGRPMKERLWSAYRDNLSLLEAEWFPRPDAREE
jgi:hypothetical protein